MQWTGCAAVDATWEKLILFKDRHPQFQLEDELFRNEGGSVVDAFVGQTYQRRRRVAVSNSTSSSAGLGSPSSESPVPAPSSVLPTIP